MIIDLGNLGKTAKRVDLTFDPVEIDLESETVKLTGKTDFSGEIERVGAKSHLSGVIKTNASLDCTRCLDPIKKHFEFSFRAIFSDPNDTDTSVEVEVRGDELDESPLGGGKVDAAEIVREQILLELPEQIFCAKDCKGLCPKCGENLNLIDCKCADEDVDPRWAALKNVK